MNPEIDNIILQLPHHKMQLATQLREIILSVNPEIKEIIKWTRVTYIYKNTDLAFICSCPGHQYIELGFFKGIYLKDEINLLENKTKAKEIRRIKIFSSETIPAAQIQQWIEESIFQFSN